jgi:hypothetical protein
MGENMDTTNSKKSPAVAYFSMVIGIETHVPVIAVAWVFWPETF